MSETLWTPSAARIEKSALRGVSELAADRGGPAVRRPRRALGLVGRGPGPVLGLRRRLLRCRLPVDSAAVDAGAHRRPDAVHPLVHRGAAELGATPAAQRSRRRHRAGVRPGGWPAGAGDHLRRPAPIGGVGGRLAAPGRGASRRPGRRVPAEHRARGDRLPGRRVGRCGVGMLLPGLRGRGHHRSPRPARTDRARSRRTDTTGTARMSTAATSSRSLRDGLPTLRHFVHVPYVFDRPAPDGSTPWDELLAGDDAAGVRTGRVLPSAVGAVHLRHHRAAQGPGARARRHHPGRAQVVRAVRRAPPGRAHLHLHLHRLGAVEHPDQRAHAGREPGAVRGQPRPPAGRGLGGRRPHRGAGHAARCRRHHRHRQRRGLAPAARARPEPAAAPDGQRVGAARRPATTG